MERYNINNESWQALYNKVGGSVGEGLCDALGYLYDLYEPELVDWFVGLYDAKIGGWYYSESGRDNERAEVNGKTALLLPDAESTYQALRFIRSSGMTKDNFDKSIPERMRNKIAAFIRGLQDPDGFFYHPQWGKDITVSRRGRDSWWAHAMLEVFGVPMKYPTMATAQKSESPGEMLIPDHLKSAESFKKYLSEQNIETGSYGLGNTLASQILQIKGMGYTDILIDYLDAHQHKDTGHWHPVSNYAAINGLMKVSGLYGHGGRAIPHAMEAAASAIAAISSDEPIVGIVDLWNTWVAVSQLRSNQREFGGEEGARIADKILSEVRRIAPEAIRKSRDKITPFKKPKGAFSYLKDYPAPLSQGAIVTVPGVHEGDVNATLMGCSELITTIYSALGLSDVRVPLYDAEDYESYLALLNAKMDECEGK